MGARHGVGEGDACIGLTAPITPTFLAMMGRGLVRRAECLWEITVTDVRLVLLPISHLTVTGGASPSSWQYQVTANSPDTVETRILPTDAVIHCWIGAEPSTPWQGRPPMATASGTGSLAANLELRLGQEAGGQSAALGALPQGDHTAFAADMKSAKGSISLMNMAKDWFTGGAGTGGRGGALGITRFGAAPPEGLVQLRRDVQASDYGACVVPASLLEAGTDGTAQREAWRRLAHETLSPVLQEAGVELADKLDTPRTDVGPNRDVCL